MSGDPRLTEAGDVLQFVYRKFVAFEKSDDSQPGGSGRPLPLLDLHFGHTSSFGRIPGDSPPVFGEVGIDLGSAAGLSLEPSYRVVLDQGDRLDSHALAEQVLKLGARIRF